MPDQNKTPMDETENAGKYHCWICGKYYDYEFLNRGVHYGNMTPGLHNLFVDMWYTVPVFPTACQFCACRCDTCGRHMSTSEGLHSCKLDEAGFLTGEEIHRCDDCNGSNKIVARIANENLRLSITTNTTANGQLSSNQEEENGE
jgi:hypothetical protein